MNKDMDKQGIGHSNRSTVQSHQSRTNLKPRIAGLFQCSDTGLQRQNYNK